MKTALKLLIIITISLLSPTAYSFPELPFCPAGGPPGWMNYFDYKRDQNKRQRYSRSRPPYSGPYYYKSRRHPVGYFKPDYYRFYPETPRHYAREHGHWHN